MLSAWTPTTGLFARSKTGHAECWGDEAFGDLGNGAVETEEAAPVRVQGLNSAVAITDGIEGYCAEVTGQGVSCWGIDYTRRPNNASDTGYSTVALAVPWILK